MPIPKYFFFSRDRSFLHTRVCVCVWWGGALKRTFSYCFVLFVVGNYGRVDLFAGPPKRHQFVGGSLRPHFWAWNALAKRVESIRLAFCCPTTGCWFELVPVDAVHFNPDSLSFRTTRERWCTIGRTPTFIPCFQLTVMTNIYSYTR